MVSCGLSALNVLLTLWLLPGDKIKITKERNRTVANDKVTSFSFLLLLRSEMMS